MTLLLPHTLCCSIHVQLNVLFSWARFQRLHLPSWCLSIFPNHGKLGTTVCTLRTLAVEARRRGIGQLGESLGSVAQRCLPKARFHSLESRVTETG